MKKLSCVLLIIGAVIAPSLQQMLQEKCGVKLEDITKAISQSDSTSNFAPWVVTLGYSEGVKEPFEHLCSGTIIAG